MMKRLKHSTTFRPETITILSNPNQSTMLDYWHAWHRNWNDWRGLSSICCKINNTNCLISTFTVRTASGPLSLLTLLFHCIATLNRISTNYIFITPTLESLLLNERGLCTHRNYLTSSDCRRVAVCWRGKWNQHQIYKLLKEEVN